MGGPRAGRRATVRALPPAERWLRRGTALVAALLAVAVIGGSAARDGSAGRPSPPVASGPSGPASASPPPSPPPPVLADRAGAPGLAPTPAGVSRALGGLLADRRLGARVVAQVVDAAGTVLLDRQGSALATPASTTKLVTAAAALTVLSPEQRLTTRVVAGAGPGEVVLVGGGDPTLSSGRSAVPVYPGAGRLSSLATAVQRSFSAPVRRVVVDGSRYVGPLLGPSWDPRDVGAGYVAPITPVMVDAGRLYPALPARSASPDLAAGRALAGLLGAPGAAVVRGPAPAGAKVLGEVRSAPLGQIIERMLLESDNVLAEAVARQVALAEGLPASFAGAAEAVRRVLDRTGVELDGSHLVDGSGLAPQDQLSPQLLVAVLRRAVSVDRPALHALVPGLPVAAYDGTLGRRYGAGRASAGAGAVRAKTGTLNAVSTLAGIVTDRDGRLLVFAFMANRVPLGGTLAAEDALDAAAAALAGCGCR